MRISDVVEEGRVEYVPVAAPVLGSPGPSRSRSPSSKRKRKISRSPVKLPRQFEISSPPASPPRRTLVEDPSFASALTSAAARGKSRWSGRDRRAAPVFQMGFSLKQSSDFLNFAASPSVYFVELPFALFFDVVACIYRYCSLLVKIERAEKRKMVE